MRIKSAEQDFRLRFRAMLEEYMRAIHELGVDPEAAAIAGITSETIADTPLSAGDETRFVDDALEPPAFVRSEPEPPATSAGSKPIPPFKPDLDAAVADGSARPHARATRHVEGGTQPLQLDEPPSTGFVQSLTLGEMAGPDLRPDTPTFEDPNEFAMGRREPVGERDDDLDIEEID